MTAPNRLPGKGRLKGNAIHFSFDGKKYAALEGDTLASALIANDVHLVGRSFKYHRPRGILTHGSDEPNALLQIDRGPGKIDPNSPEWFAKWDEKFRRDREAERKGRAE